MAAVRSEPSRVRRAKDRRAQAVSAAGEPGRAATPASRTGPSAARPSRPRGPPAMGAGGARELVAAEALGLRDDGRARRGEEVVELGEPPGVEDAGRLRDAVDLLDEAVALDAVGGVLERVLGVHDHEARPPAGPLAPQD